MVERVHNGYFKPQGVSISTLDVVTLTTTEAEALRLADLEGKGQEECAAAMRVSQPTFHRELKAARQKVAEALLNKRAIRIGEDEGETMPGQDGTGPEGKGPRTGRGIGRCNDPIRGAAPLPGGGMGRGFGRGAGAGAGAGAGLGQVGAGLGRSPCERGLGRRLGRR